MTEQTANATESTDSMDLSWLANVEPVETKMRTSRRGRQPGSNPTTGHVKLAHQSGKTLSLPVPAKAARKTERMLRRAALREAWSISVQVLSKDPEHPTDPATSGDVVALKDLGSLPEGADVWVSFNVSDKEDDNATDNADENADATGDGNAADNADPFAGTPESPATETASEPTPEPRTGRRSGRKGRAA